MAALPLSELRLIATLPPVEHFSGVGFELARVLISALRQLGATVLEFDTSDFYRNDLRALQRQIDDVKSFKPDGVIALPSAGYAVEIMMEDGGIPKNVFLDILELPTILYWDHALIHAPRYVVRHWPSKPLYSTGNVKGLLRSLFSHPLAFHIFPDTGHISEFQRMGIATFEQENWVPFNGVPDAFIDYAQSNENNYHYRNDVGFFGNLYISAAQNVRYEDEALTAIREAALAVTMSDWDYPAYYAYLRAIDALDPNLRSSLRLDADQSFYWRFLYDELSIVANGESRFRKPFACGRPVTWFGGFGDPQSRKEALKAGWMLADEYLPYGPRLAAAFHQSRVSIDVTNALFINGFTAKPLACFAAGGFMLTTRKADMNTVLGSLMDTIGFSSAAELAEKVDRYLTHDRQRLEVASEIRELLRRDWSTSAVFARMVPLALDRIRARISTGVLAPTTAGDTAMQSGDLGTHLFDVCFDSLKFVEGASGQLVEQGLEIETSPQQWAYSLYSPMLGDCGFTGEAVIRVQVQVGSGLLGLALATRESISEFVVEFSARASGALGIIDIPVADLATIGALVVRNQSGNGRSEATIRSIQVFRPEGYDSARS